MELQGSVESREETVRELMQKLAEGDNDQRSVKQEAERQTEELTKEIKMLQDQLLEVISKQYVKMCQCNFDHSSALGAFQGQCKQTVRQAL